MNSIPTPEECVEILKKNGCSRSVINHCKAVRNVAVKIAARANADVKLVEASALLHDIGRSKTHGIRHAIEGAKIIKKIGLSKKIVRIIERHIGAGLPVDEAKILGLPAKEYMPKTLEEKIVCHADSLIENSKKQNIEKEIEQALMNSHEEYAKRLVMLHKELSEICGIDVNKI